MNEDCGNKEDGTGINQVELMWLCDMVIWKWKKKEKNSWVAYFIATKLSAQYMFYEWINKTCTPFKILITINTVVIIFIYSFFKIQATFIENHITMELNVGRDWKTNEQEKTLCGLEACAAFEGLPYLKFSCFSVPKNRLGLVQHSLILVHETLTLWWWPATLNCMME